ncbi:hypothetical protein CP082626L3_0509B, partial [Chlamydia psittaci 08-2626_L3]
GY